MNRSCKSDGSECVVSLDCEYRNVFITPWVSYSRGPTHVFISLTMNTCLLFLYHYQSRLYGKRVLEIFEEHISIDISFPWNKQFLYSCIRVKLKGESIICLNNFLLKNKNLMIIIIMNKINISDTNIIN